jgi:acetyl esterase/lipase
MTKRSLRRLAGSFACAAILLPILPAPTALGQTQAGSPRNMPLWKGPAPLAHGTAFGTETVTTDIPSIDIYLPAANPTKTGVLIVPGGGYAHVAIAKEGAQIAQWLNARGVAAFVLHYRVAPYHYPAPLLDDFRAIRVIRAHAAEFGIGDDRIGVWGFSAGGHMASTLMTHFEQPLPDKASLPVDATDKLSARPAFGVLAYPVITMDPTFAHMGSRKALLGETPDPVLQKLFSNELQVTNKTPPTFLFATTDDPVVPVMNSVRFYEACAAHKVPVEMHLYEHGPHGTGLAQGRPSLETWPEELAAWMRIHGGMSR